MGKGEALGSAPSTENRISDGEWPPAPTCMACSLNAGWVAGWGTHSPPHASSLRTRGCLSLAHDPSSSTAPSLCTRSVSQCLYPTDNEGGWKAGTGVPSRAIKDREISISLAWLNCLLLVPEAQVSGMWPTDTDLPVAEMVRPLSAVGPRG